MMVLEKLDEKLLEAAKIGNAYKVIELLREGANVNTRDEHGFTPLHYAAFSRDADVARLLLEHGADANAKGEGGVTPLHHAAIIGNADVARLLLDHGADVNARDKRGSTPLHHAAVVGSADFARLLLERGADPSIRDKDGRTPLDVARERGHEGVARVIEEYMRGRRGVGVEAPATPVGTLAQQPAPAAPSILSVECPELRAGEWGRLLVRVRGSGTATLSLEGDVDWMSPEAVELSGEAVVEVPVKPRVGGEIPVKVRLESSGSKSSRIVWLKVADRVRKCPGCGAPVEPGAKYCWRCGAKLS
jgi:hypothetical protein